MLHPKTATKQISLVVNCASFFIVLVGFGCIGVCEKYMGDYLTSNTLKLEKNSTNTQIWHSRANV
ncbi:hypothetical protein D770_26910 [Flammeovirgaceae bacterium 311]|nr:hypothetical protein D770_26910 [Flammeovirgaceae bacterium 311]